ncbi:hypothetical protein ADIMK_4088 [Marinobacterium lacunae]|uniref:PilZ domain-containing protein n=1 Tax=Marinobacterium lacunae TaxID=1232683 RepID=A0A081FTT6_9GAMM|nr:PilZ domain-containing protein [Marinobacterium lacunae]KEA61941.1 hypothetical protein ADIMK_4088 [Marinobacterium lacunae]MBR9883513.1 PilZ domain-containing protein [Oceanospirillales bacterium]
MHDDRRLHPRVDTDLDAQVLVGQDNLPVRMVNLSVGGLMIEGSGQLAGLSASPATGTIEIGVRFDLEHQPVNGTCRVVYKRRLSADKAALGLKIIDMDEALRAAIDRYVRKNLTY